MEWKVCGMRDEHNIKEVLRLEPDYMGFIFYAKSPRFVGDNWSLSDVPFGNTSKVGVFVNEAMETVANTASKFQLDFIQLHGDESAEYCEYLYHQGLKIIKAIGVGKKGDFDQCSQYKKWVKYFLFDTQSAQYGGTGESFNWSLIDHYDQQVPFILSGGLTVDIEQNFPPHWNLAFIDVNSRFEIEPGLKDVSLLNQLKQNLI
jgi:phosphoribosylanthranilate isomerase